MKLAGATRTLHGAQRLTIPEVAWQSGPYINRGRDVLVRVIDQRFLGEERTFLDLQLFREDQRPGLMIQADGMKLDFVRQCRRKPCAAHYTDLASVQAQLGNVARQTDEIIDMRLSHCARPP